MSEVNNPRLLLATPEEVQKNMDRLNGYKEEAKQIAQVLCDPDGALMRFANAPRPTGHTNIVDFPENNDDVLNSDAILETHAAIVDESIRRFQDAVKRFSGK